MKEIRCSKCNRLLGIIKKGGSGSIEIKCPRCDNTNEYLVEALEAQRN